MRRPHARVHALQCAVVDKAFGGACSDHVVHTRERGAVHLTFFMPSASLVEIAALQRVKGAFVDDDGLRTVDVGWSADKKTLKVTCALGVAPRVKRRPWPDHGSDPDDLLRRRACIYTSRSQLGSVREGQLVWAFSGTNTDGQSFAN